MILITGAGGKTGQAILRALSRQGGKTRALLRDGSRREAVHAARAAGAGEVATGGFTDLADLRAAMQGVGSFYHLKMFVYYEKFNFRGSPRTLECLLGRKPRGFWDYIQQFSSGDLANK